MTFGMCTCYIVVTVAMYGRWRGNKALTSSAGVRTKHLPALLVWEQSAYQHCWRGNKALTSSAGVGTKRLPALLVWEQSAYQHCWRGNKMLTSTAGKRFASTPPSIYGGVRGAYVIATAVTVYLHVGAFDL